MCESNTPFRSLSLFQTAVHEKRMLLTGDPSQQTNPDVLIQMGVTQERTTGSLELSEAHYELNLTSLTKSPWFYCSKVASICVTTVLRRIPWLNYG